MIHEGNTFGATILALADRLAEQSDTPDGLTCLYMTPAHRAVAAHLRDWMQDAGLSAEIDAAGNVVGRIASIASNAKTLIIGSHYDTVRNAGRYDGRLGILAGLVVAAQLVRAGDRLPFNLELIGFSEEEGVRFGAPFIGSKAVAGRFEPSLLDLRDDDGASVSEAMRAAGHDPAAIPALARRREDLLGFVELHIEQGPVLLTEGLPVGIVTSIAAPVRLTLSVTGQGGHAGTVPMGLRRDALAAAAEIILAVEKRCGAAETLVGTVGVLKITDAAGNVIPGRCELSLDIRAADDATRDAALDDILREIERIAARRNVTVSSQEIMRGSAVACSALFQTLLADATTAAGVTPRFLPSGAGHDAMVFDGLTDLAMLFVRCGNGGISHSPLESITAGDADVAARILLDFIVRLGRAIGAANAAS
jgi:hydantoinase/carbamoylase family amidase